jgi:hypothetical protein
MEKEDLSNILKSIDDIVDQLCNFSLEKDDNTNNNSNGKKDIQIQKDTNTEKDINTQIQKDLKNIIKDKKKRILYIGIDINNKIIDDILDSILNDKTKPNFLENKTKKEEYHVTLIFKPTKEEIDQIPSQETKCKIYLEGIGYSENAVAIKVEKILTEREEIVPYFLKKEGILHITISLAEGIKPVNSYLAINEGNYDKFEEIICIDGNIKYYY